MRSFELHVHGLPELVGASGEDAVAGLIGALATTEGILDPRYDGARGAILFGMDEFREDARAPSFAQLSAIVEAFAAEGGHDLHVLMINRTVD